MESSFELPDDNRLPVWFELPKGIGRLDVGVRLEYWIGPAGRTAAVTLHRASGGDRDRVVAVQVGDHPIVLSPDAKPGDYPGYEILTARGKTEVIEHRRMEPLFFICDDLEVKKKLGVH